MNNKHRFSAISLILALAACFTCTAVILPACDGDITININGGSDDGKTDDGSGSGSGSTDDTEHEHVYSEDWAYDETYHWHYCTVDGCEEVSDKSEHNYDYDNYETSSDGNFVYTCSDCGYQITEAAAIYSVTLTNIGGAALSGVDITLYTSSGSEVSSGTTSSNGVVRFRNLSAGTYSALIDEDTLPKGYSLDDPWVTLTASDKNVTVKANSAVITDEEMPSGHVYSTGDVMYDFTVTCVTADGSSTYEVTLSDYLSKYNAVLLNFFYTTCGPCIAEVPYMEQAYSSYSEKVGLIAFDYKGMGDTEAHTIYFKNYYDLSFDFTYDNDNYYSNFGVVAFPTTVIIDRYGCIAEMETGNNVSAASWISIFEYYISDSYEPSYTTSKRDDTSDSQVESDVTMPESEDIVDAIVTENSYTTADTFTFSNYSEDGVEDVYNWPWIIGTDDVDGCTSYIKTSNAGIVGGYSIIVIDVTLKAGQGVMFDYLICTESGYDIFYVQVDTVLQLETSGDETWQSCLAYYALYDGDYQITLYYQKDSSKNYEDDTVYVSNLRVVDSAEIAADTTVSADILYNAATNYADSSVDVSAYGEGYGYYNYVDVYYASDGYYHVDLNGGKTDGDDPEDDPYLLADIYYGTPWYSTMSLWYEVYAYGDEVNTTLAGTTQYGTVYDAFEDYAWVQNNCPWGYIPVNQELHDMLVAFVSYYGRTTGDLLENQWLELCRYYVHYGADHDDCSSLDNLAETYGTRYAKDVGEVSAATNNDNDSAVIFTAEIPIVLVPRGNYYSFTVDTSGIYRIYSYDYLTDADAAPYAFLMDENGNTLASSESDDLAYVDAFQREGYSDSEVSYDFAMYVYLEAGTTYFLGCTFGSTEETGSYRVGIHYIGDELSYFTTLATGSYYTYYEVYDSDGNVSEYKYYLPTRLSRTSYALNDADGYWYTLDENGDYDQLIYIDMVGSTWWNYYSSYTIEEAIEANAYGWTTAQLAELKNYLSIAKSNTGTVSVTVGENSLYGCVPADSKIVTYINNLCNGGDESTSSTYADNAWMLTAYFVLVVE